MTSCAGFTCDLTAVLDLCTTEEINRSCRERHMAKSIEALGETGPDGIIHGVAGNAFLSCGLAVAGVKPKPHSACRDGADQAPRHQSPILGNGPLFKRANTNLCRAMPINAVVYDSIASTPRSSCAVCRTSGPYSPRRCAVRLRHPCACDSCPTRLRCLWLAE